MNRCTIGLLAGLLVTGLAVAPAEAQDSLKAARKLEFTGDIGFVNTAGNTDVTTLNVGEQVSYRTDGFTLREEFGVVYGRTDGVTSTSLWRVSLRSDYTVTPALAVYASAGFDRNTFAGISRRFVEGAGLTLKAIRGERNKLEFEAGVSLTQQRSTLDVNDDFAGGRVAGRYQHYFNPTAYAQQTVEVLPNLEMTEDLRINSETSLVAPLSERLAVKLSYVIRFDNLPEPDFEKTDRLFTSGLQVSL